MDTLNPNTVCLAGAAAMLFIASVFGGIAYYYERKARQERKGGKWDSR